MDEHHPTDVPAAAAHATVDGGVAHVPETLSELLARHGSDPEADSRTRIRPSLLAVVVSDLHVGIGLILAMAALHLVGPTPHAVWNAFAFGLASAIAVLAIRRPSRSQGRRDVVLAALLATLVAAVAGVGTHRPLLGDGGTSVFLGATVLGGLLLALFGLHIGRGPIGRIGRIAAPVVPVAAALAVSV